MSWHDFTPNFLLGLTSPNKWPYLLWSGVFGYLLIGFGYLRHHNCHVKWCLRGGKHPLEIKGVHYVVCTKHHPDAERLTKEKLDALG